MAAAVATLVPATGALAAANPLVGAWSHSDYTKDGKPWLVTYLAFSANGAVGLKAFYTGAPAPLIEVGQYRLGAGGALQMVFKDFSPKQCVTIAGQTGCEPPPIPLGQTVSRGTSVEGASLRFSDGAVYTRAAKVP